MARRVEGKTAIIVGGGQTPGQTVGNGRAVAMVLAREGARVLVVDRHKASAQDTVDLISAEGGEAWAHEADTTDGDAVRRLVAAAHERFGRLDILHNNVGASLALGDATATELTVEAFDRNAARRSHRLARPARAAGGRRIVVRPYRELETREA
jgi:NAD(P)-dependent dehydrogenase (short-subunit alcohol dehydrogenase family)